MSEEVASGDVSDLLRKVALPPVGVSLDYHKRTVSDLQRCNTYQARRIAELIAENDALRAEIAAITEEGRVGIEVDTDARAIARAFRASD